MHVRNLVRNPTDNLETLDKQTNNTTNKNTTETTANENKKEERDETIILKSNDVATFKVDIVAPEKEGTFHGQIFVKTLFQVNIINKTPN